MLKKMLKIKTYINHILSWILEKKRNQKNGTVLILSQLYIFLLSFCITFFTFKLLHFKGSTMELLTRGTGLKPYLPLFGIAFLLAAGLPFAVKFLKSDLKSRIIKYALIGVTALIFIALTIFFFYMLFQTSVNHEGEMARNGALMLRFLLSYLIILIICEFFYFTTFFLYTPLFIVYPLVSIAGIINVAKVGFRNEPFVFTDLLIFRESLNIGSDYPLEMGTYLPYLIRFFIVLLILPLFIRQIKFERLNIVKRVTAGFMALVIAGSFFSYTLLVNKTILERTAKYAVWNLADEYRHNGFVLSFLWSTKRSIMLPPADYNRNNVREYALELGYPEDYIMPRLTKTQEELPNVIVIMNEAYWDTDNLTGIAFNQDPLESVRGLLEKNGATLLSPQIGGGTSNVEFEFLTGKNGIYYPPGSMIYQQFINKKHWSLAW
jgi:hypothetical protein